MSTKRYFNWGGREIWTIDFSQAEKARTDQVFIIESADHDQSAMVDFAELSNLRMYVHENEARERLKKIKGEL